MTNILASWHIVTRSATVIRTKKYVVVNCRERWGGDCFSRSGWSTFIPRKQATTEWIGENLKKALYSSEDFGAHYPRPFPDGVLDAPREESNRKGREFWENLQHAFGFEDILTAKAKSALIFVEWPEDQDDQVCMTASQGRGAGHSAWGSHENFGKVFFASIHLSDL